jgi:hypothetical protein
VRYLAIIFDASMAHSHVSASEALLQLDRGWQWTTVTLSVIVA